MEVLARALAKEPAERFETVAGMAEALRSGVARMRAQSELNETQAVTPVPPREASAPGATGTATGGTRPGASPAGPGIGARLSAAARGTGAALASAGRSLGSLVKRGSPGGEAAKPRGQAAASAKEPSVLPSAARLALVAGVALAVGVILAGLLLAAVRDGDDLAEATALSPEHQQRVAAHPYLMAANEQLREGDPAGALVYLEVAQQVGPDLRGVKVRRQQVERQAGSLDDLEEHAEVVARGLVQARIAAEAGQWRAARTAAQGVLEVEPENDEAAEIVERAESGLAAAEQRRREEEALQRAAREAEERMAAMSPEPEPEPEPEPVLPELTGESTLELYFYTELPEGTLTLYLGKDQIARERFRFYDRKFLRQVPSRGEVENRYTVEPGDATIRIIVALEDRPPITREIQANFPDGSTRKLDLRLREDFSLQVAVE
jgi:hypothetical protein